MPEVACGLKEDRMLRKKDRERRGTLGTVPLGLAHRPADGNVSS